MNKTVIVLMGRSGSGKSRLENKLVGYRPNLFHKVTSVTTRPPRVEETSGNQYYFTNQEGFEKLDSAGKLIQKTWFHEHFYGSTESEYFTPHPYAILAATPSSMKTAAKTLEQRGCDIKYVYFDISGEQLRKNMTRRGDSLEQIDARLAADDLHIQFERSGIIPDYVVKDGDLDEALHIKVLRWLVPSEGKLQILSTG